MWNFFLCAQLESDVCSSLCLPLLEPVGCEIGRRMSVYTQELLYLFSLTFCLFVTLNIFFLSLWFIIFTLAKMHFYSIIMLCTCYGHNFRMQTLKTVSPIG